MAKWTHCSHGRRLWVLFVVLTLGLPAWSAAQTKMTDQQELEAIVVEFTRLESIGDFQTQSKMIAPDRWFHNVGGRRTDNAMWVKVQTLNLANREKRYPGLVNTIEVRDLKIRMVAPTVAIASFTWFYNRSIPGDLPADKVQALGPAPVPQVLSHVYAKQADGWKLVSSHMSPEYLR